MAMLDTPAAHVPTLSLADQARDPDGFAAAFGRSFERFGFAIVADHGIGQRLIDRAWALTEALFALPEDEKRRYHIAGGEIGRAHVCTPVTNAHHVYSLLIEIKQRTDTR